MEVVKCRGEGHNGPVQKVSLIVLCLTLSWMVGINELELSFCPNTNTLKKQRLRRKKFENQKIADNLRQYNFNKLSWYIIYHHRKKTLK